VGQVTGLKAWEQYSSGSLRLPADVTKSLVASDGSSEVSPQMLPPPPTGDPGWYAMASWSPATAATRYEVKLTYISSGASTTITVTTAGLPRRQVDDGALKVSVRACNAVVCSAWAGPVTAVRQ
jgi:hypothetical protein